MSSKTPSSNNIAHARRTVQQLRIEASIERIKVSKASADLMNYCAVVVLLPGVHITVLVWFSREHLEMLLGTHGMVVLLPVVITTLLTALLTIFLSFKHGRR